MSDLIRVQTEVCRQCLDGLGAECHMPGCAFWMNAVPKGWVLGLLNLWARRS